MNDLLGIINPPNWGILIPLFFQVLIISYVMAWSWQRIIGSQAEKVVKGVLVVATIWGLAYLFRLTLITSLLHTFVPVALIALVIIFQPELRRGLGHLGRMQSFRFDWSLNDAEVEKTRREIDQIIAAVRELSRSKTGALIVIEPLQGERDYVSPGTTVNADISTTLLLTIFFTNSPLHDGAVVIRQDKIIAAGVILPMTDDPQLSYRYGTRHRAAIGLSETYDGLCIVVSEETGAISAASRGMLLRYKSADDLRDPILYLYTQGGDSTSPTPMSNFLSLFSIGRRDTESASASSFEHPEKDEIDVRPIHDLKEQKTSGRFASIKRLEEKESQSETDKKRRLEEQRLVDEERKSSGRRKHSDSQTRLPQVHESTTDSTDRIGRKSNDELDELAEGVGSVK